MSETYEVRMTEEQWADWLKALRSGEYRQGKERLWFREEDAYCCLGVFCHLNGVDLTEVFEDEYDSKNIWGEMGGLDVAPEPLENAMPHKLRHELAEMNDDALSFEEIAAWLEDARKSGRVAVVAP